MHAKSIAPKDLDKPEDWKRWRADVEDYCEETFDGMKVILVRVRKADEEVDE